MLSKLQSNINKILLNKPLILALTNYVTMEFVANSILSVGAAPIMSESIEEIEELLKISLALYINIGTLNHKFLKRAEFACQKAKEHNIPVILDPVGVGASKIRVRAVKALLPFVDIIRGNASEILAAYGNINEILGVESIHQVSDASLVAKEIALKFNITVMVSGEIDYITDGKNEKNISFGSPMMQSITGVGCSLTAVISAFRAININSYEATIYAASYFGLSGQLAQEEAKAPGSFKNILIDYLYKPNWEEIRGLYERK